VARSWRRGILVGALIVITVLVVATLEIHSTHTL
jgi:hypothetical protein